MSGHPAFQIWYGIVKRCTNPSAPSFARYGARGIRVCKRWLGFAAFVADMGAPPFAGAQVDRIDNDGHYEPGNCRWATPAENSRNKRNNRFVEHAGVRLCIAEWAARAGLSKAGLAYRLDHGWMIERALTTPPDSRFAWRKGVAHA